MRGVRRLRQRFYRFIVGLSLIVFLSFERFVLLLSLIYRFYRLSLLSFAVVKGGLVNFMRGGVKALSPRHARSARPVTREG